MRVGMIGLGRMGGNMARRLGRSGVSVYGFSLQPRPVRISQATTTSKSQVRIDDLLRRSKRREWSG